MKFITLSNCILIFSQVFLVLLLSPFLNTVMKKFKAVLTGRVGPPVFQGYYDLIKYFHKETVVSNQTSWLFIYAPYIIFSITLCASLLVPTFTDLQICTLGGIVLLIYLLGMARFFIASAAMEAGSGFCGMASSREMMLAVLVEPVLLLSLFVLALMAKSTDLSNIVQWVSAQGLSLFTPAYLLSLVAILVASIAEMGRVPFDNPETHYELTMIHEGMLLEYSGKLLGLMLWSAWIKQLLIMSLLANLFIPIGYLKSLELLPFFAAIFYFVLKLLVMSALIAVIETVIAKVRLFRVKDILVASFVISIIALVISTHKSTGGFGL